MKGWKIWTWMRMGEPSPVPGPKLTASELKEGILWPYPPEGIVRFSSKDSTYVVDVEVATTEGQSYITGISVRSGVPTSPDGTPEDPWLEGASYDPVVPRDVQRLPLSTYAKAALANVADPLTEKGRQGVSRILVPRLRPERGRGAAFYKEILKSARQFEAQGLRPAAEIARRKRVSENLVHQWLHRGRKLDAERLSAEPDQSGHDETSRDG